MDSTEMHLIDRAELRAELRMMEDAAYASARANAEIITARTNDESIHPSEVWGAIKSLQDDMAMLNAVSQLRMALCGDAS